jgi:glycosyltransferase involved in cell wall biosynthesis
MSIRPAVTVVIPSWNHAAYIGAAIRSVFRQTLPPAAVIILDDGSEDGSVAAIEAAIGQSSPIPVRVEVQTNAGAAATLNRAISWAETPYIAILNSDDIFPPTRLERMMAGRPAPTGPEAEVDWLGFSGVGFIGEPGAVQRCERLSQSYLSWWRLASMLPTAGFGLLLANICSELQ